MSSTQQVNTVLIDLLVNTFPSADALSKLVVAPLEAFAGTTFAQTEIGLSPSSSSAEGKRRTTVYLEAVGEEGGGGCCRGMTGMVRVYDRRTPEEKVMVTVSLELPGNMRDLFDAKLDGSKFLDEAMAAGIARNFSEEDGEAVRSFPTLRRCLLYPPYLRTSDGRLAEYNFQEVLFHKRSPYQLVQIVLTPDFGRTLVLDGLTNLSERDTVGYTHALMNLPHEDYKDKTVLILGGGDGGLIHELLSLPDPPGFVTMIDIDEVVMDACNEFLRGVCGDALDRANREGPRHKIITGCAVQFLKEAVSSGKQFDYVFGDLTDTPVDGTAGTNPAWDFLETIVTNAVKLVKPDTGRYMTHCNGKNAVESIESFERLLGRLEGGRCSHERSESFVPSFVETWVFFRVKRRRSADE